MTSLYNCHTEGDAYRITKFSTFGDVESSYVTTGQTCECPAGHRHTCRHRQMLPKFLDRGFVDTFYFYDFDRDGWVMNDLGQSMPMIAETAMWAYSEEDCPGHTAFSEDSMICANCGIHIDSLRPDIRAEDWAEHEAEIEPLTIATYVELPANADVAEAFGELVSEALRGESDPRPLPDGVTMLDLSKTSPMDLYNTIADAVGEPRHQPKPWRRI